MIKVFIRNPPVRRYILVLHQLLRLEPTNIFYVMMTCGSHKNILILLKTEEGGEFNTKYLALYWRNGVNNY